MIAKEGVHYNICSRPGSSFKWREYTALGEKELTMFQRWRLDAAFLAGKLGSEFAFTEPNPYITIEEYLDEAERIDAEHRVYEYTEAEDERIADCQYKEQRIREEFEGESRFWWLK